MARKSGSRDDRTWTADDVTNLVSNPIYAGIGRYPAIVPEEQWIEAVAKLIKERGVESVLRDILNHLRQAFPAA